MSSIQIHKRHRISLREGRLRPRVLPKAERVRCPRRGPIQSAPGRLRELCPAGTMTGLRGDSLDWDRKERVTPASDARSWIMRCKAHGLSNHRGRAPDQVPGSAYLELSCGVRSLQQEPWWNADRRARCALSARRIARCGGWKTRLSAFRLLFSCRKRVRNEVRRPGKIELYASLRFASYCLVALSFFVDCTTRARIASREQFVFSPRGTDDQNADAWRRGSNRSWRNCEHRRPSDRLDSGHGRPGDRRWFCSSKRFACFAFLQFRIFEMRDVAIAHRPKAERARLRQPRPEIIKERSYRRRIEC